jgi:TM2 domain-containing membrane protein YozV
MTMHEPDGVTARPIHEISAVEAPSTLDADRKYCHACAAVLDARAVICPKCGVSQASHESPNRNRVQAGIFALLLGGLGVHKFYLGRPGMGIVYLLFCWTFIPAFIGFIEGLVYLTMSDERFAQKYG